MGGGLIGDGRVGKLGVVAPMGSSVSFALRAIQTVLTSSVGIPCSCAVCGSFDASRGAFQLRGTSGRVNFSLIGLSSLAARPSPGCLLMLREARGRTLTRSYKLLVIRSSIIIGGGALRSLFSKTTRQASYTVTTTIAASRSKRVGCPCLRTGKRRGRICPRGGRYDFYYSLLAPRFLTGFSFRSLSTAGG